MSRDEYAMKCCHQYNWAYAKEYAYAHEINGNTLVYVSIFTYSDSPICPNMSMSNIRITHNLHRKGQHHLNFCTHHNIKRAHLCAGDRVWLRRAIQQPALLAIKSNTEKAEVVVILTYMITWTMITQTVIARNSNTQLLISSRLFYFWANILTSSYKGDYGWVLSCGCAVPP